MGQMKTLSLLTALGSFWPSTQAQNVRNMQAAEADLAARRRCPNCGSSNYS